MNYSGQHHTIYTTTHVLGRGGEGAVYDLTEGGLVLKLYNEPLSVEKIKKLVLMANMQPSVDAYAAWPTDVVQNGEGAYCGFVMKKLAGYVPLHLLFSPMDRKKKFPDKGYNFLVHVARNLATAVHKLHEAGLIIGDINEGNILVNASGMVAFIDCDSFQVKGPEQYFFCDVGVPRYTAPELLRQKSFDQVVRTVDTDSFSLAVLLFQLLFLGRHPFAGTHKMPGDFPEETAILKKEFAYSLENKRKKLAPPRDSFPLEALTDDLIALFHQAFEQEHRPHPAEWVKALDHQLLDIKSCPVSALHNYPGKLATCPWCDFQSRKGILYFLDESFIRSAPLISDIEQFVNGFDLTKLKLEPWIDKTDYSTIVPAPVEKRFLRYRNYKWLSICSLVLVGILGLTFRWDFGLIAVSVIFSIIIYVFSPWTIWLHKELDRLVALKQQLELRRDQLIRDHDHPHEMVHYEASKAKLLKYTDDFRKLPEEYERRRRTGEERMYEEQLENYLGTFYIETHTIPSFGFTRKSALVASGIITAADIGRLQHTKVPGIGPKNVQVLLEWRRQMASGFLYIPDTAKMADIQTEVSREMGQIRTTLEHLIRKEYQSLTYQRMNLVNRNQVLAYQINDLAVQAYRASQEEQQFRKMAA